MSPRCLFLRASMMATSPNSVFATISSIEKLAPRIVAKEVWTKVQLDTFEQLESFTVIDAADAVVAACDKQLMHWRDIPHTLRLLRSSDALDHLACAEINHLYGVVRERRHEEPPAFDIRVKMVHPPIDRQRNRLHESQRRWTALSEQRQAQGQYRCRDEDDSFCTRKDSLHN